MIEMPFVPLIDRGVFEESGGVSEESGGACIADVIVPLMLVRHVAELPDAGAFPDAVERLRADVARHLEHGERQYPFVTGQTERGDVLGVILYPALRKAEVIGLAPDLRSTARMTLSPNGVHLLHGWLVFAVHSLATDRPGGHPYGQVGGIQPENADVAAVRRRLLAMVEAGDKEQALTAFSVRVVDVFGRPHTLRARWYPHRGLVSWEWEPLEGDLPAGGVFFDLEQAALLAGFLTLLRLAYPEEWSWREK